MTMANRDRREYAPGCPDTPKTAMPITGEDGAETAEPWHFGLSALLKFKLPRVPLFFLGIGVYRAWIEIAFVGSFVNFPSLPLPMREWFDTTAVFVMLLCVLLARRIGPFYRRRSVFVLCGTTMVASTAMLFATILAPAVAPLLGMPAAVLGGIGLGLIILIWSEVYGCLNPLRVTLYYAASMIAGALIVYVFMGFRMEWLAVFASILPLASLIFARRAMDEVPAAERPAPADVKFKAPWKIFLLMALYAFAYGIIETRAYSGSFGPHSSPGCLIVALIIFLGVALRRERFDFNSIVRIALPLMIVAFWMVPALGIEAYALSGPAAVGGYTAVSVLIMTLCSNMCYRYGVSAIWLFGIERSVRLAFMILGRGIAYVGLTAHLGAIDGAGLVSGFAVTAVLLATLLLFRQKEITGNWGANLLTGRSKSPEELHRERIAAQCAAVANRYRLTGRETEILNLLAQRKTVGMIERELFIANGTAKAHVRHIYQKLDIHSREELFALIDPGEVDPLEGK